MLNEVITTYQTELETVANAWLASGASSFGITQYGRILQQWPDGQIVEVPKCTAPIRIRELTVGELYVTGVNGPGHVERLTAEANLLARFTLAEAEMDSMAGELIKSQDELLTLYNMMESTAQLSDLDSLISGIATTIQQLFAVQQAFVWLIDQNGRFQWKQTGKAIKADALKPLIDHLFSTKQRLVINDVRTAAIAVPSEIENALLIPLVHLGDHSAVLGLLNKEDGPFGTPTIMLLEAVGQFAEAQIDNRLLQEARLEQMRQQTRLSTEVALARDVQMHLMPQQLPHINGLDTAATSCPALSVGGDFYDCWEQPNGNFFFTLGDVSGKGMSAALLMAMLRTTIRNASHLLENCSPQAIFDHTNHALYDDFTDVGMFATIFAACWEPTLKRLTYANAGHVPVIHKPNGRPAYLMEVTGTAMAVLPDNMAFECAIPFGEGDLLVVATDGLNEASNQAGDLFDIERLLQVVDDLADKPANEILQGLYAAVAAFSQGQPQEDDQTVFIVKGVKNV